MIKKLVLVISMAFTTLNISAQVCVESYEDIFLPIDTFINNAPGGVFHSSCTDLPNNYIAQWDSWDGWAISSMRDTVTKGPTNQYSSMSGGGTSLTDNYAVSYVVGESIMKARKEIGKTTCAFISLNNNAYAYYSMLEGDAFAKKFGGESGDDPDWFKLTIRGFVDGELTKDSVDFYLADYRFDNNDEDYIIKDWTTVNLDVFGMIDSLQFTLSSSDNGRFGMNTPAYFCVDDMWWVGTLSNLNLDNESIAVITPNPVMDEFRIMDDSKYAFDYTIVNNLGQVVQQGSSVEHETISSRNLERGVYRCIVSKKNGQHAVLSFVKI